VAGYAAAQADEAAGRWRGFISRTDPDGARIALSSI
jgi:hypothetical protein